MAPLGAGGAIPGSDDARPTSLIALKMDAAIPLSVTTSTLPASGTPETPASSRTRRNCDATDASVAADRSEPLIPRDPFSTGTAAVRPNKNE
jgi:hypothetical protein